VRENQLGGPGNPSDAGTKAFCELPRYLGELFSERTRIIRRLSSYTTCFKICIRDIEGYMARQVPRGYILLRPST
jgi:hypothetical protein